MRFLTREWYYLMQQQEVPYETRKPRLDEAMNAWRRYHERTRDQLHPSMRAFSEVSLHDGWIESARQDSPGELTLAIDGRECVEPRGRFNLSFRGVRSVEGLDGLVGKAWLHEEPHPHPEAGFDYQVLLAGAEGLAEFRVIADEVVFEVTEPAPQPTLGIDVVVQDGGELYVWATPDEPGAVEGWCCLADGKPVAKQPPEAAFERMREFARAMGATIPGETPDGRTER